MTTYTYAQLEGLWINAGGSAALAPLMAAIAEAESGGNPAAVNATDNGGTQSSFGLWQISNGTHTPPAANWSDGAENAALAVAKYKAQGLAAWGTYTSGAYKAFLSGSTTPDTSVSTAAALTSAGGSAENTAACLFQTPNFDPASSIPLIGGLFPSTSACLVSKTQARAVAGAMVLASGVIVAGAGLLVLAAYGLGRSMGLDKAANAAAVIPGAEGVAAGLTVAHRRATRSGSDVASSRATAKKAAAKKAAASSQSSGQT